jgi:hypothetical protein
MAARARQLAQQILFQPAVTLVSSAVACQQASVTRCSVLQAGLGKETQLSQWQAHQAVGTCQEKALCRTRQVASGLCRRPSSTQC